MKKIAILGSTGSIGRKALQVVDNFPDEIQVLAMAAGRNRGLLLEQAKKYKPRLVSIEREEDARWLRNNLSEYREVEILSGREGLQAVAAFSDTDTVLTAITGAAGLEPTINAIRAGKHIALANKETLVAAGELVTGLAQQYGVCIMPVDSEHSAVWQCFNGEDATGVARIILTASGGPFRNFSHEQMTGISPDMALKHPNWQMGAKITVDSATLMNKGLEVIEARWLFDVDYDKIDVVIHPQSIIHSMVEFVDGSVLAQLGVPDMALPIQYALLNKRRLAGNVPGLKWPVQDLTFEKPDRERFPSLALAYEAGQAGGTMPAVMNAANEVAVAAFLAGEIGFTTIPEIVAAVMHEHTPQKYFSLEEIMDVDSAARQKAKMLVDSRYTG